MKLRVIAFLQIWSRRLHLPYAIRARLNLMKIAVTTVVTV